MEIGFIGLGRMGMGMVGRLRRARHQVVAYDCVADKVRASVEHGATGVVSLEDLVARMDPPRAVWLMLPAGPPTEQTIGALSRMMQAEDVIVDGGNSYYKDDGRRAAELNARGIYYLDVGVGGGIEGGEVGYCLMVGGDREIFRRLEPIFRALATSDGYAYLGRHGAGHYVKTVHNGIAYGLMQAYAEGFELLHRSDFALDLPAIAHLWRRGSDVSSWLLDLAARVLEKDPQLAAIQGYVEDSGEGRWMLLDALEKDVPAPTLALSLFARFRSRQAEPYADKLLAGLRNAVGGHPVRPARPGQEMRP